MNIFGIPLFVSISEIELFLNTYLSSYVISNDTLILLYFIVNFMYIDCIVLLIRFFYKVVLFIHNHVFS